MLRARRYLFDYFSRNRPDLFIGIDAPDFNLSLEKRLRAEGITTVHYVCPTFWAWRSGRVKGLRKAADLVLSIFPIEKEFLASHGVNYRYVGHPLAETIPKTINVDDARKQLKLSSAQEVVALLPGSRMSEVKLLAEPFVKTATMLAECRPGVQFVMPCPKRELRPVLEDAVEKFGKGIDCRILDGDSHIAMSAADVVLTASGTATMETLMHKRPMVVGYRVSWLSYVIFKYMIKVPYIAMANLLAGEMLAPELLQHRCRPELLAKAVGEMLDDMPRRLQIQSRYTAIHDELCLDSSAMAAQAVVELLQEKGDGG
jgi:lipid-A-disaccharide synthase